MDNIKVTAVVDTDSLQKILNRISQIGIPIDTVDATDIIWKVGIPYKINDIVCFPVIACAYKTLQRENPNVRRGTSIRLSDLYAEQSHTDCRCHPILEIQPTPFPDGTPLLRKE